jgi:hypothetical protein
VLTHHTKTFLTPHSATISSRNTISLYQFLRMRVYAF